MKMYILFGMKSFTNQLAYRSDVWLRTIGNFATIFIQVSIWKAVIGEGTVSGVSYEQMVTYSILNTLLAAVLLTHISGKVDTSLKSGSIASDLIRPLSYPIYLFAEGAGSVIYQFVFVVVPSLLIASLAFGIQPPASAEHFASFAFGICIALLLSFLFGYLISLIAFWFLTHFSLEWMFGGLTIIFAGSFLPLWFFPDGWAAVAKALPFQYLGFVPAALYMGQIPKGEILNTLVIGLFWITALWLLTYWLWSRAVKRLVVQGG
jgi:ABC-2 type transport system permease protein